MDPDCLSIEDALRKLDTEAPNAPLLALGQTALWDEPMKAGLALALKTIGSPRRFVAGVHDTDYFAKLPSGAREPGQYRALPHNGTSTRSLWSASAEFSALFGSETVITRQDLLASGTNVEMLARRDPTALDAATEAYGWRGLVSLDEEPPLACDVPLDRVFQPLQKTLHWAIENSLAAIPEADRAASQAQIDALWTIVCDAFLRQERGSLTDFYADLAPSIYAFTAQAPIDLETTRTTELLKFNRSTCRLPRFALVDRFLDPDSRPMARQAYDAAIHGSEIYPLARFGTGAIPFDLVVPGHGRGAIRIGRRGIVINTPKPLFATLRTPVLSIEDLAEVVERKFGPDCALIGKAVTLIGMLATEFVFAFHAGASSYVKYTQRFHQGLEAARLGLPWHPILRVNYDPWSALSVVDGDLQLPAPMTAPFGSERIPANEFAARWRQVGASEAKTLRELAELRRPIELIQFLSARLQGEWIGLATEYASLHDQMVTHAERIEALRVERWAAYDQANAMKLALAKAELAKGTHFRERLFERDAAPEDVAERARLSDRVAELHKAYAAAKREIKLLIKRQREAAANEEAMDLHARRRNIELRAEIERLSLIRNATICSRGLERAGKRPSAWWFGIVSPDGAWWRETVRSATCAIEPLSFADSGLASRVP